MQVRELVDELALCDESNPVYIEVKGEWVRITEVFEDSQGVYLIADPDLDEREMR